MVTAIRQPLTLPRFFEACHCASCPLAPKNDDGLVDELYLHPVGGYGNLDARVIFVGEAPGRQEELRGLPFIGDSGQLLDQTLETVGLQRSDCYATNAVLCRPTDATGQNRPPLVSEILACNGRLQAELASLPNKHVIVVLGGPSIKAVTGKNAQVSDRQGTIEWSESLDCFLAYTWHPAYVLRQIDAFTDFQHLLRKVKELLDTPKGPIVFEPPTYTMPQSVEECLRQLRTMCKHLTGLVACDIETDKEESNEDDEDDEEGDARDWQHNRLTQIAFSRDGKRAYIIPETVFHKRVQDASGVTTYVKVDDPVASILYHPQVLGLLRTLLAKSDIQWLWHYGKFDCQTLHNYRIEARVDEDTHILSYLLSENPLGGKRHGLKTLVRKYLRPDNYGAEKAGFTDPVYHAKDVCYTWQMFHVLHKEHACEPMSPNGYPPPLTPYKRTLIPATNMFMDVERYGVAIDEAYLSDLDTKMAAELAAMTIECRNLASTIPGVDGANLNINSWQQLLPIFYNKLGFTYLNKKGKPSTDKNAINDYLLTSPDPHPFIWRLKEYRVTSKLHSTYVVGLDKRVGADGITHTTFKLASTVTGRTSSEKINIQNLPVDSPIKRSYIARPGHTMVEIDYSNQEVRVGAIYTCLRSYPDAALIKALDDDFHSEVSKTVFRQIHTELAKAEAELAELERILKHYSVFVQLQEEHQRKQYAAATLLEKMYKALRKAAKAVTFGVMYGEGPKGLKDTLWLKNRIGITLEESTQYITDWLKRFPQFARWREEQKHAVVEYEFVDTPEGRRRRFPLVTDNTLHESERQALNMPVQSLASDMAVLSAVQTHDLLKQTRWGHALFLVHDSIMFEIKDEYVDVAIPKLQNIMEHVLPDAPIPFPTEAKVGRNWGEMHEWKASVAV